MVEELSFCGCGLRVTKPGNRFIKGHNRRGAILSKEHIKKLRDRKISSEEIEKIKKYWSNQCNRDAASRRTAEYFENVENRDNHSKIMLDYYEEHPEFGDNHSKIMKDIWKYHSESYDDRNEQMKDRIKKLWNEHPEIYNERNDMMKGGNDIVNHHYLYDHSDLLKNTVKMTRSDHSRLHWLLWRLDVEVPHINFQ